MCVRMHAYVCVQCMRVHARCVCLHAGRTLGGGLSSGGGAPFLWGESPFDVRTPPAAPRVELTEDALIGLEGRLLPERVPPAPLSLLPDVAASFSFAMAFRASSTLGSAVRGGTVSMRARTCPRGGSQRTDLFVGLRGGGRILPCARARWRLDRRWDCRRRRGLRRRRALGLGRRGLRRGRGLGRRGFFWRGRRRGLVVLEVIVIGLEIIVIVVHRSACLLSRALVSSPPDRDPFDFRVSRAAWLLAPKAHCRAWEMGAVPAVLAMSA